MYFLSKDDVIQNLNKIANPMAWMNTLTRNSTKNTPPKTNNMEPEKIDGFFLGISPFPGVHVQVNHVSFFGGLKFDRRNFPYDKNGHGWWLTIASWVAGTEVQRLAGQILWKWSLP